MNCFYVASGAEALLIFFRGWVWAVFAFIKFNAEIWERAFPDLVVLVY